MANVPVRKYGFLVIGIDKTISVPAKFDSPESAMAEASQMAVSSTDRIVLVDNRTEETKQFLGSTDGSTAWLNR